MRNHASLKVVLLGLLTLAFAPGYAAAAGQGQDLTEMLASNAAVQATAVSGPVISVSPLTLDFGTVDAGTSSAMQNVVIKNTGDATLNVASITFSDAAYSQSSGAMGVLPGNSASIPVTFRPLDGSSHPATMTISSNASNGTQVISLSGQGNAAPTLAPVGNKIAFAFVTLSFNLIASDDPGSILTYSVSGLPPTATLDPNTGAFSWFASPAEAGTYNALFSVSDGRLSGSQPSTIAVTVSNNPPRANAGTSYFGVTGKPVNLNGSGSSDPDAGQMLTYAWSFGDGHTSTSQNPQHIYQIPGSFVASLTVCDNGSPQLCDTDVAAITIKTEVVADLYLKRAGRIDVKAEDGTQTIGIQEILVSYTTINLATLKLTTDFPNAGIIPSCPALTKGVKYGDMNVDGVTDFDVLFERRCLDKLFRNANKDQLVNLIVLGEFVSASGSIPLRGVTTAKLVKEDTQHVAAFASPNPFNPETSISYSLRTGGAVTMRVYSVDGRLVRTLKDGEYAQAGSYEVRWNGVDNSGGRVPSGIYFIKTNTVDETSVIKAVMAK